MLKTQSSTIENPLHQFSKSELVLVELGDNLDKLDKFIYESIGKS